MVIWPIFNGTKCKSDDVNSNNNLLAESQYSAVTCPNTRFSAALTLALNLNFTLVMMYLLTYSMVQSPSWAANWFAASQEIPNISRNPKVHYRTHKLLPPVSIFAQPSPVHIPTSHILEIHSNIIHLSTPRSPQWTPSLRFSHQHHIHLPLLTHTRHMTSPSYSSQFFHQHNTGWGVQII